MAEYWEDESGDDRSSSKEWNKFKCDKTSDGYREGREVGVEAASQEGFDIGFHLSCPYGVRIGRMEGRLRALLSTQRDLTSRHAQDAVNLLKYVTETLTSQLVTATKFEVSSGSRSCEKCGCPTLLEQHNAREIIDAELGAADTREIIDTRESSNDVTTAEILDVQQAKINDGGEVCGRREVSDEVRNRQLYEIPNNSLTVSQEVEGEATMGSLSGEILNYCYKETSKCLVCSQLTMINSLISESENKVDSLLIDTSS